MFWGSNLSTPSWSTFARILSAATIYDPSDARPPSMHEVKAVLRVATDEDFEGFAGDEPPQ